MCVFSGYFFPFIIAICEVQFPRPLHFTTSVSTVTGEKDLRTVVENCFKSNETLVVRGFCVNSSSSLLTFLMLLKVPGSKECLCRFHIN